MTFTTLPMAIVEQRVERARGGRSDDVGRDDRVLGVDEPRPADRHPAAARNAALTSSDRRLAREDDDEVGDRAVGDRHPQRHAVELALQSREHEAVAVAAPVDVGMMLIAAARAAAQVLVRQVQELWSFV